MNSEITTNSRQRGHIKDAANVLSATPYTRFACEASGREVVRGNADKSSYLLTIELTQFGQQGQKHRAGLRADAGGAAEDFIFFTEVIVGFDVLLDEIVEFGNLIVKGFEHLADAFANLRMADGLASIQFLNAQVGKLSAATHQVSQFVGFGAGGQFWLWLNDLGKTGEDCGIDGVGLGKFADASCEVTNLAWGGDNDFKVCPKQFGNDWTFVAAGCFEDYQGDAVRLKGFDELFCARGGVGQRNVDETGTTPNQPVLIDRFLDDAIEIDVDALFDGSELYMAGIMEHIEEAGIHSGDSACVLPSISLKEEQLREIHEATEKIAKGVDVRGLINIQFAISRADGILYVLEANPRASRTVPFVSKATGIPLAKAASLISIGESIKSLRAAGVLPASGDGVAFGMCVKEAVLPWNRFRRVDGTGVDSVLGPEMRSTGEVMGIAETFGEAYAKSQIASFGALPKGGSVFLSLSERDKAASVIPAKRLTELGFTLLTTSGTHKFLADNGVQSKVVRKNSTAGEGLSAVDIINTGQVDLVINTPLGRGTRHDGWLIRTASVQRGIPIITTIAGFKAAVEGIVELSNREAGVRSLQQWQALVGR